MSNLLNRDVHIFLVATAHCVVWDRARYNVAIGLFVYFHSIISFSSSLSNNRIICVSGSSLPFLFQAGYILHSIDCIHFTMKFSISLLSTVLLASTVIAAPHKNTGLARRRQRRA